MRWVNRSTHFPSLVALSTICSSTWVLPVPFGDFKPISLAVSGIIKGLGDWTKAQPLRGRSSLRRLGASRRAACTRGRGDACFSSSPCLPISSSTCLPSALCPLPPSEIFHSPPLPMTTTLNIFY